METKKVKDYLDSLVERGIPSVDLRVMENHKLLYTYCAGTVDEERKRKTAGDEWYLMFSMTKVQTMTAVLMLLEQGKLSLEDEVGHYLKSYRKLTYLDNGVEKPVGKPLLLWQLLSMQSGLDYNLTRPGIVRVLKEKGENATTRDIVESFPESPLSFQPGEHFQYSLSHDVVAAIIEVVSGMRFSEYLRKNLWEPLHMENTFFAKPMNHHSKLVTQYVCGEGGKITAMEPSCNYQFNEQYESGGAGLISCTDDYARLSDMLACGGLSADGIRMLKPETVELLKKNLLSKTGEQELNRNMGRIGYGYGCGMQIFLHPEAASSPAPAGIFGWDGAAGSCIQMDTVSKRSFVFTMHVRNCGIAYSEFHPILRDLIFS